MGRPGTWQIVILLVIILLLFGAPKLPELARSVGKSLRILKDETKQLTSDDSKADDTDDSDDSATEAKGSTGTDKKARGK
ncbi:MAG: Sec-independent protein translocase subunit TatA [Demequina sp.]